LRARFGFEEKYFLIYITCEKPYKDLEKVNFESKMLQGGVLFNCPLEKKNWTVYFQYLDAPFAHPCGILVSISSTFYTRIFRTKVLCTAFL